MVCSSALGLLGMEPSLVNAEEHLGHSSPWWWLCAVSLKCAAGWVAKMKHFFAEKVEEIRPSPILLCLSFTQNSQEPYGIPQWASSMGGPHPGTLIGEGWWLCWCLSCSRRPGPVSMTGWARKGCAFRHPLSFHLSCSEEQGSWGLFK